MLKIELGESLDVIDKKLSEENKTITCDLLSLNTFGKKRLNYIITYVLKKNNLESYVDDIYSSLLELAFNALKANYTYMIVLEIIKDIMPEEYKKLKTKSVLEVPTLFNKYSELSNSDAVIYQVKKAIAEEGKIIRIYDKAEKENRSFTEVEKIEIENRLSISRRTKNQNIKITLKIVKASNYLIFDMINDAPITDTGLTRIQQKRDTFKKYYDDDRIAEFYMENLDETESAGYGVAMIDLRLREMGLAAQEHFKILQINHKTCTEITLPLFLKERE
jgi:hypothetical protein